MEFISEIWRCRKAVFSVNYMKPICTGVEEQKKEVPYSPEDERAKFCPLVEVPPHGRLIDESWLKDLKTLRQLIMTICKCDRCGKEIFDPHDVFILTTGKNYCRSEEATRLDLCEWCYRCLLDWVKADG